MSRRKRILLYGSLAVLVAALGYYLTRPKEPEYGGKALSYWVDHTWASSDPDPHGEALKAIRALGTNAVPDLIRMLGGPKTAFSKKYERFITKLPGKLPAKLYFLHSRDQRAAVALGMIGPDAAAAVPALIAKLGDFPASSGPVHPYNPYVEALTMIGPQAAGQLGKALFYADVDIRINALETLTMLGADARDAVPDLFRYLGQPDIETSRSYVLMLLRNCSNIPETQIQFLIRCLDDKSALARIYTAEILGKYGSSANAAIPKLREKVAKDAPDVAKAAAEALKKIEAGDGKGK